MTHIDYFNPVGPFDDRAAMLHKNPFKTYGEQDNFWGQITLNTKQSGTFLQKPFMAGMFPLVQLDPKKTPLINQNSKKFLTNVKGSSTRGFIQGKS